MSFIVEDDLIIVTVVGEQSGQTCLNKFAYFVDTIVGDPTLEGLIAAFRLNWQTDILPPLSTAYTVRSYVAERFSALLIKNGGPPLGSLLTRYDARATVLGAPGTDTGGVAGACLPSYACAGFSRNSEGPQSTFYKPSPPAPSVIGTEIAFRSSFRLAGIPEAYTETAAENELTAAAIAALEDIGTDLLTLISTEGTNLSTSVLVIPSENWNKAYRPRTPDLPVGQAVLGCQFVSSSTLSTLVTSQVSRKQRRGGE